MNQNKNLSLWTIYDKPHDFPNSYVARRWEIGPDRGMIATSDLHVTKNLDNIRMELSERGLIPIERHEDDDPKILETWI